MNKNIVFVAIAALTGIGFIIGGILAVFRPEGFLTFTGYVGTTIISITGFAIAFYSLNKVGEKIEQVEKQTNGRLTSRDEENEKLRQENLALHRKNAELEKNNA